jgi:hypothetical protein
MKQLTLLDIIRVKIPVPVVWLLSFALSAFITYHIMPNFPWWGDALLIIVSSLTVFYCIHILFDISTPREDRVPYDPTGPVQVILGLLANVLLIILWTTAFSLQETSPNIALAGWMVPAVPLLAILMVIWFYGGVYPSDTDRFLVWSESARKVYAGQYCFQRSRGVGSHVYVVTSEDIKKGGVFACYVTMYNYKFPNGVTYHEKLRGVSFPSTTKENYVFRFDIVDENDNTVKEYKRKVPYKDILRVPVTKAD